MIGRLWLGWRVIGATFGKRLVPGLVALYLVNLRLLNTIGLALDPLFFPSVRRARKPAPVVIVGNPRTGTTFLQRFLVDQGVGHGHQVWQMIFPSLTVRTVIRPLLPLIERVDPTRFHRTAAHETSLTSVEVDDVLLLPRFFDGFFPYGFFLAFAEEDLLPRFDPEKRDTTARDYGLLDAAWRRSLAAHDDADGKVIAKLFSVAARLPSFLEYFPDARILCTVRDPLAALPSAMSLVTGVLDRMLGFWSLPEPVRRRYLDRLYGGLVELMLRMERDWTAGRIPRDRLLVVTYDRLMVDFDGLMAEVLDFIGHEPDDALRAAIEQTAADQRSYVSEHKYNLAKFGLDEARIKSDLEPYYRTFLGQQ